MNLNQGVDLALRRILKPPLEEQISGIPPPNQLAVMETPIPQPTQPSSEYEKRRNQKYGQTETPPPPTGELPIEDVINYLDTGTSVESDKRLNSAEAMAMDRAVKNAGFELYEGSGSSAWRLLNTSDKQKVAQLFMSDPFKENPFASSIASLKAVEAGTPAMGLLTAPVTALATPFAKLSVGEKVEKEDWINATIMTALLAVPGLQGLGKIGQMGAKAIMGGAGGYLTKRTIDDWDMMSNPERAFAVGMDVALLAGGMPTKGFYQKVTGKAKPEEPIKPIPETPQVPTKGIVTPTKGIVPEEPIKPVTLEVAEELIVYRGVGKNQKAIPEYVTPDIEYAREFGRPSLGWKLERYQLTGKEKVADFTIGSGSYTERLKELGFSNTEIMKANTRQGAKDLLRSHGFELEKKVGTKASGEDAIEYTILYPERYKALPKAEAVPTKVAPVTPEVTPSIEPIKSKVPSFPDTEVIIRDLQQPSKLKEFTKIAPEIKPIINVLDPSKIAQTPIEQAKILQGRLRDMSEGFNSVALSELDSLIMKGAKPKVLNGIVKDIRIIPLENAPKLPNGKPSMAIHDIVEFSERYNIPDKFKPYFNELRTVSQQVTTMLEKELTKYDITLKKMAGESDWVYLRRVVNQVGDVDLQGFGRWKGMQKPRSFKTAGAGMEAEKVVTYLDPELELKYQLASAYNWITDLRVKEIITKLTTTAKSRVPSEIINNLIGKTYAKITVNKLMGNYPYTSIFSRAGRGEVIAPQTMAMIRRSFPDIADKLAKLINENAPTRKFTALKKSFMEQATNILDDYSLAKASYKRALEEAGPHADEAMGVYLPGRIFTTQELAGKKVMGRDIMREVEEQFGYKRPGLAEKGIEKVGELGGILRQTKAALDLSVQGIQTLPALGIDTMNLIKAPLRLMRGIPTKVTASWIQGAFRGWERLFNSKASKTWMAKPEIQAIQTEMIEHGALLSRSEFAEATGILGKIPVLGNLYKWTGAAFTWGRDATETYLYMSERSRALRGLTDATQISTRLDELAKWSNIGTGMLSTRGMGVGATQRAVESVALFAPKLARSVLANVVDITKGGLTGRMARDSIMGLMTASLTLTTALSLALGQKPRINPLPESAGGDGSKFATIKIGKYYIGLGSTYRQLASLGALVWDTARNNPEDLISFSMDNPVLRTVRGKMGPPMALGIDLYTGHDYLGELTRNNLPTLAKTFGDWAIPIWADEILEAVKRGIPGWQVASMAATQFFGGRTVPETDWDVVKNLREIYSNQDFDKQFKDLNNAEIKDLMREHTDLADLEEAQKAHWAETGGAFEKTYYDLNQKATEQRNQGLVGAATALQGGRISKDQYDGERSYIRPFYSGAKSVLWAFKEGIDPDGVKKIEDRYAENAKPEDKAMDAYWDVYGQLVEQSELPRDWDMINATLDSFLTKSYPEYKQYVLAHKDDWIKDLPEPAKTIELQRLQGIADGTWWNNYKKNIPTQTTTTSESSVPLSEYEKRRQKK